MAETGILPEGHAVELLEGEIYTMSPVNSLHAGMVNKLNRLLMLALPPLHYIITVQNPIRFSPTSEPEPDLAVLRYRADFYQKSHPEPKDAFLLIEVSDSSFRAEVRNRVTEQLFFVLMQAEFYTRFSSSEGIVSWKTLLRELFYLSVLTDSSNFEDFQIASDYILTVLVGVTLPGNASSKECSGVASVKKSNPARFRPMIERIQKRVFFELARMTLADLKDGLGTVMDSRSPRVSLRIFLLEKYTAIIKGSKLLGHFKPDLEVLKSQLIRYIHRLDNISRSRDRNALLISLLQDIEQGIELLVGDFDQKNDNTDLNNKIE